MSRVVDFHVHMLEPTVFQACAQKTVFSGFGANPVTEPRPGAKALLERCMHAETVLEDRGIRKGLRDFVFFWYDFLIGDDLIGTAIVLAGLEATYLLTHSGTNAWWLMPIAVAILLPVNLFRVTR